MSVFDSVSKVKICVLSHPRKLVTSFIKKLCQEYPDNSTYRNFAALGMSFTTINDFKTDKDRVNIILLQTTNQEFESGKLKLYYRGSAGAIILFKNGDFDSFEAAKRFFHYFRKVTYNPSLPVIFIDLENNEIIIDEPEQLEDNPNILYYQIEEHDLQSFYSIIESIINKHLVS